MEQRSHGHSHLLESHAMIRPRLSGAIGPLLLLATLRLTFAQEGHTAPAFLWSPGPVIGGGRRAERQVSYEVRHCNAARAVKASFWYEMI